MALEFNDFKEEVIMLIMDGGMGDEAFAGDIICAIDIEVDEILGWIEKHKYTDTIHYKNKEYKGEYKYRDIFIFKERIVLDKFLQCIRFAEDNITGNFLLHDLIYQLSSTAGRVREIKLYDVKENIDIIEGMVEFVDSKTYEKRIKIKDDDIGIDRVLVKVDAIDYEYREIFYSRKID